MNAFGTTARFSLARHALAAWLVVAWLAPIASAEIIIDDFDEPFEITESQFNKTPIVQRDIGTLNAERHSSVFVVSAAKPTGNADANLSQPSVVTFKVERLNPSQNLPYVALDLDYLFDEMDLTEGGRNDRVALDFAHLRSSIPIGRIDVYLADATQSGDTFVQLMFDVPPRDEPFTLEFPFDSFGSRGGGPGYIDFERIDYLHVGIAPSYYADADEINFSAVLERVRITGPVPEPTAWTLSGFAILVMTGFRARTRESMPCARNRFLGRS